MRQIFCLSRRKNAHAAYTPFQSIAAGFQLWQHATGDNGIGNERRNLLGGEPRHDLAARIFHPRNIGQKNQRVGATGNRAGRRHLISIHVVVLAVGAEGQRREHGNTTLVPDRFEPAWLDRADLTHKSQVVTLSFFFPCAEGHAITAAKADGGKPGLHHCGNNFLIHHSSKDHHRHIASLGVGDAQAIDEVALLAEKLERPG